MSHRHTPAATAAAAGAADVDMTNANAQTSDAASEQPPAATVTPEEWLRMQVECAQKQLSTNAEPYGADVPSESVCIRATVHAGGPSLQDLASGTAQLRHMEKNHRVRQLERVGQPNREMRVFALLERGAARVPPVNNDPAQAMAIACAAGSLMSDLEAAKPPTPYTQEEIHQHQAIAIETRLKRVDAQYAEGLREAQRLADERTAPLQENIDRLTAECVALKATLGEIERMAAEVKGQIVKVTQLDGSKESKLRDQAEKMSNLRTEVVQAEVEYSFDAKQRLATERVQVRLEERVNGAEHAFLEIASTIKVLRRELEAMQKELHETREEQQELQKKAESLHGAPHHASSFLNPDAVATYRATIQQAIADFTGIDISRAGDLADHEENPTEVEQKELGTAASTTQAEQLLTS